MPNTPADAALDTPTPAADPPKKSWFDQLGVALPVALTALSTALAGLSTGELQRAMVWRSAAAQDQSKATSQWTLAGFKRDRALICQVAAAQLRAGTGAGPNPFIAAPPAGADPAALEWLAGRGPGPASLPDIPEQSVRDLVAAVQKHTPEADIQALAGRVRASAVDAAIAQAEQAVTDVDQLREPTAKAAVKLAAATSPPAAAQAAGFDVEERRYRVEATLNQGVGSLYEARVRVSGATAERHQRKSKNFFYAMLAAQVGATAAALALARQRKSVLWAVAGGTGVVAIAVAGAVYLADV